MQNEQRLAETNAEMNIRNVNLNTDRAENYRQNTVQESGKAGAGADVRQSNGTSQPVQDRVEISDAARAAVSDAAANTEINFARKALLGMPPLSEKRAADILARVQSGYYSQPDVLKQIAERVGDAILPGGSTE